MRHYRLQRVLIAQMTLAVLLLASCAGAPAVDPPDGFAQFPDRDSAGRRTSALAISPEGVGFEVRATDNDPQQSLAFWTEALERHMLDSGYLLYERHEFSAPAGDGGAYEWLAPVGADDWIYLTAIVVTEQTIVIAEAAGPYEFYRAHREAILGSLETIAVDG